MQTRRKHLRRLVAQREAAVPQVRHIQPVRQQVVSVEPHQRVGVDQKGDDPGRAEQQNAAVQAGPSGSTVHARVANTAGTISAAMPAASIASRWRRSVSRHASVVSVHSTGHKTSMATPIAGTRQPKCRSIRRAPRRRVAGGHIWQVGTAARPTTTPRRSHRPGTVACLGRSLPVLSRPHEAALEPMPGKQSQGSNHTQFNRFKPPAVTESDDSKNLGRTLSV